MSIRFYWNGKRKTGIMPFLISILIYFESDIVAALFKLYKAMTEA